MLIKERVFGGCNKKGGVVVLYLKKCWCCVLKSFSESRKECSKGKTKA